MEVAIAVEKPLDDLERLRRVLRFEQPNSIAFPTPTFLHSLQFSRRDRDPSNMAELLNCVFRSTLAGLLLLSSTAFALPGHPNLLGQIRAIEIESDQPSSDPDSERELQKGTVLTRNGQFAEAIPHLLAARGRVANEYAANFNLAICYVATDQPKLAIPILSELRTGGHDNADVSNLLAQAYVGDSENQNAIEALERAAWFTPTNEKLYLFVADACMSKQAYGLGMQVVDLGLKNLPHSAQLHFERAMFLSLIDQFDTAKPDFELARKLRPDSDIAFLATAQQAMFEGNIPEVIRSAREGISRGRANSMLLALLGEALLRTGVRPGQPEFEEARQALENSVAERANYPSSHLALGKLDLMDNRVNEAIAHLETARQLDPGNPSVYSNLAAAYQKQGDLGKAQQALAVLEKINAAQAEKIRSAPGDRRAGYAGPERAR
jgi:predicted Zn-dependent protease